MGAAISCQIRSALLSGKCVLIPAVSGLASSNLEDTGDRLSNTPPERGIRSAIFLGVILDDQTAKNRRTITSRRQPFSPNGRCADFSEALRAKAPISPRETNITTTVT